MYKTHLAFGFLIGLLLIPYFHPVNTLLFIGLCLFGSLLPDIDHPRSKVGRHIKVIGFLFEHRGFFHSGFAIVGLLALMSYLSQMNVYAFALAIGYASHILIDMMTKEGIMLLHPFSHVRLRGVIQTGALVEKGVFLFLLALNTYLLFRL